MHHVDWPRHLHTEPPAPPVIPDPDGAPVPQPPLPPDSPHPGKPQKDPPRGPPDQPLEPPAPIITSISAAFLLALTASAWAADLLDPQDRPAAFRQIDIDGDGWISVEEAAAEPEVAANFQKADQDRDGKLSIEEFETIAINRSDQPGKFRNPDRG